MTRPRPLNVWRWILAAFAVQLIWTSSLLASCGDWLAHPAPRQAATVGGDRSPDPASQPWSGRFVGSAPAKPRAAVGTTVPIPPPPPCDGPGCRQAPAAPPMPAPPSGGPEVQRDGLSADVRLAIRVYSLDRLGLDETLFVDPGYRPRVERPPRV